MSRLLALALALVAGCGSKQSPPPHPPLPELADAGVTEPDAAVAVVDDGPDDPHHHDPGDPHELSCEDVIRDLASYPPALADDAPERTWNLEIRAHVIEEDCEHLWSYEDRECVATQGAAACAARLPGELVSRLTKLGELGALIAASVKKPATISCAKVAAAHYADIRWHGRLDGFAPAERKQMIADSRKLMLAACKSEAWTASTRACLVLGGAELCFFGTNIRRMWGYPADGSVRKLGVPECDDYDAAVTKLAACPKIEEYVRESLLRMAAALKAQIASLPAADRARRGQSCRAAFEPIADMAAGFGC